MRIILFSVVYLASIWMQGLYAVDPASLRCLEVNTSGAIKIHWLAPANPVGQLVGYRIWRSSDGTSFSLVATVGLVNDYLDNSINGNLASYFYYVEAEFNVGGSTTYAISSDTLQSIFLTNSNTLPISNGFSHLSWNSNHPTALITNFPDLEIYQKIDWAGGESLDVQMPWASIQYNDLSKVCSDSVYYQIRLQDSSGCYNVSNYAGNWIEDILAPGSPKIDSASVNPLTGEVAISWTNDGSGDIGGYYLLRNGLRIDTLIGKNATAAIDITSDAENQSEQYGVQSFDTCYSGAPPSPNFSPTNVLHNTLFLEVQPSICDQNINLTWTNYVGWNNTTAKNDIFYSENNGAFKMLASISGTAVGYLHTGVNPSSIYCYYIRSEESVTGVSVSSNQVCSNTSIYTQPSYLYISSVSVFNSASVRVKFIVEGGSDIAKFNIYRSKTNVSSDFEYVASKTAAANTSYTYIDTDVGADTRSFYYRVEGLNPCGDVVITSNMANTILLNATAVPKNISNDLTWNKYTGWGAAGTNVVAYKLFRSVNGTYDNLPIAVLGPLENQYSEDLSDLLYSNGSFCYYIEADESSGNIYGLSEFSRSNTVCVVQQDLVFVPTVFTPNGDGVNDVFIPSLSFIDTEQYSLVVFNRWGSEVFSTEDVNKGWDPGADAGLQVPYGYYSYFLQFKTPDERVVQKRGSILMMR